MKTDRATTLRLALYGFLGFGFVTRTAEAIGMSRVHVSEVLNGHTDNTDTLDKIEAWLEAERQTTAEAA